MIAKLIKSKSLSFCNNNIGWGLAQRHGATCLVFCSPDSILLGFGDAVAEGRCLVVDVGVGVVNGVVGVGSGIERLQLGPWSSSSIASSAQGVRIFTG